MPCSDPGRHLEREEIAQKQYRLDLVTRLLCELCQTLEAESLSSILEYNPELIGWWKNHKREDQERFAREERAASDKRLKEKALAKLSPAEKKLLKLQ